MNRWLAAFVVAVVIGLAGGVPTQSPLTGMVGGLGSGLATLLAEQGAPVLISRLLRSWMTLCNFTVSLDESTSPHLFVVRFSLVQSGCTLGFRPARLSYTLIRYGMDCGTYNQPVINDGSTLHTHTEPDARGLTVASRLTAPAGLTDLRGMVVYDLELILRKWDMHVALKLDHNILYPL